MENNNFYNNIVDFKKLQGCFFSDTNFTSKFLQHLFDTLFICKIPEDNNTFEIQTQLHKSQEQLELVLNTLCKSKEKAKKNAADFFVALPDLYNILIQDAKAIFNADPAAKELDQVLLSYPGFFAIGVYRFAHQLLQQNIPLLPRIFTEYAHSRTGIDIHPGSIIGKSFSIDHGTGIVIGETTEIGDNVKIYQCVTLGALSVQKHLAASKRHPTIKDNVVIYAGATILGGQTVIGMNSVIGGNVWLTHSVEPFSVVYHQSKIIIQDKRMEDEPYNEPYNYFI